MTISWLFSRGDEVLISSFKRVDWHYICCKKYYLHRLHAFVTGAYILKLFTPVIKTERQKAVALCVLIRLRYKLLAVKSNIDYYARWRKSIHRLRNIGLQSL